MKNKTTRIITLAGSALIALGLSSKNSAAQVNAGQIKMTNNISIGKISLWGNDNTSKPFEFYGFGILPSTLLYNVDQPDSKHLFLARNPLDENNPRYLMSINGNGDVLVHNGNLGISDGALKFNRTFSSLPSTGRIELGYLGTMSYRAETPDGGGHVFSVGATSSTAKQLLFLKSTGEINIPATGYLTGDGGLSIQGDIASPGINADAVLLRLKRPPMNGAKYAGIAELRLGSYGANLNSETRMDFVLNKGASNSIAANPLPDNATTVMSLFANGKVGIGVPAPPAALADQTSLADYKLFVNGGILAKEVRVRTSWADYVFSPEYKLNSLEAVESHIKAEGHLPGMPSASQVEESGLSVGEIARLQQEKIEELTLYIIKMNKEIEALKAHQAGK